MAWNDEAITIQIADIHIHLHQDPGESDAETFRQTVLDTLGTIVHTLSSLMNEDVIIEQNQEKIMSSLDDDIALVQAETTQVAGVKTMITALKQQVADALSGVTLPPAVQTKVDAIFTGLTQNSTDLATAIATGPNGQPLPAPGTGTTGSSTKQGA